MSQDEIEREMMRAVAVLKKLPPPYRLLALHHALFSSDAELAEPLTDDKARGILQ